MFVRRMSAEVWPLIVGIGSTLTLGLFIGSFNPLVGVPVALDKSRQITGGQSGIAHIDKYYYSLTQKVCYGEDFKSCGTSTTCGLTPEMIPSSMTGTRYEKQGYCDKKKCNGVTIYCGSPYNDQMCL